MKTPGQISVEINSHQAASSLMAGNLLTAIMVSSVHALAMIIAGGAVALAVFDWLGPKFIARSWFNLDLTWALSLILVGGISLASATIVG